VGELGENEELGEGVEACFVGFRLNVGADCGDRCGVNQKAAGGNKKT
jgi:hypothetical protein